MLVLSIAELIMGRLMKRFIHYRLMVQTNRILNRADNQYFWSISEDFGLSPLFDGWPRMDQEHQNVSVCLDTYPTIPVYLHPIAFHRPIPYRERSIARKKHEEFYDNNLSIRRLFKIYTLTIAMRNPPRLVSIKFGGGGFAEVYHGTVRIYST